MSAVRSPRARAYLELVRVPNLFTAAGDIFAGYLIVSRGVGIEWPRLLALVAASVCLYAGGVVLNDYFDRDVDGVERPDGALALAVGPGGADRSCGDGGRGADEGGGHGDGLLCRGR